MSATRSKTYDVVVVGSGFGGSINALRAAEAGKSVLVLERGREYPPPSFPRDPKRIDQLFWEQPTRSDGTPGKLRGLYEVRCFPALGIVTASGLGGGSLVYANIHVRPDEDVFEDPRWPRAIRRATLEPYFDRVAAQLQLAPPPADTDLPKRKIFRAAAQKLGREVFDPHMAVAWKEPPGPGREACSFKADCELGCPVGAKNSLDLTYLAEARRLGTEIRTRVFATHVEPCAEGYRVHLRRLEEDGSQGPPELVEGRKVVLAAGTLGTHEILFRSRDELGTLPNVSARLGVGFSGNGDFLGSVQNAAQAIDGWNGPDVTSVMRYCDGASRFTLAAPSFNRGVMEVLASHGQPAVGWLRFLSPFLWERFPGILKSLFRRGVFSHPAKLKAPRSGPAGRMTNLFAIGRDNANGRITFERGKLRIRWSYAKENAALIERMTRAMEDVAGAYGGTFRTLFTWQVFRRILTVHPLGGCNLSETPETGVVTPEGEVHGHPGLYIADGSVIPTSIGFHPCMTIAGVAERVAEKMR